jgi:phosphatidate cytidylyltransferase
MHKTRIFTGLALSALALLVILGLSTKLFAAFSLVVILFGASEWAVLTGLRGVIGQGAYVCVIALFSWLAWSSVAAGWVWLPLAVGGLWWIVVAVLLALWQSRWSSDVRLHWGLRIAGLPTLVPAWIALVLIHRYDPWLLIFLIVLAAVGDTAAYFTGKRFGRRHMAPQLSPGKTWEGLMGELLAAFIASLIGASLFFGDSSSGMRIAFVLLAMLTVFASVCGDLFESLLKRVAGAKDSGHLLPGHGGVLDRMDSHLAAAPIFLIGLTWLLGGAVG